jgi:hypothetical protein
MAQGEVRLTGAPGERSLLAGVDSADGNPGNANPQPRPCSTQDFRETDASSLPRMRNLKI